MMPQPFPHCTLSLTVYTHSFPNRVKPESLAQPGTPFMCADAIPKQCIGRGRHATEDQHQSKVAQNKLLSKYFKEIKKADRLYGW